MAQKKITDLTLRSDFDATVNLPGDDTAQTWRVTGAQIKAFVLGDGDVTLAKLASQVAASLNPAGVILPFGGTTAPTGYLICNGDLVSRTTYADLFAAIGTAYGSGDGSTTFALPNAQGVVLRGVGSQPINGRTKTGPSLGVLQEDQLQGHIHNLVLNGSVVANSSSAAGGTAGTVAIGNATSFAAGISIPQNDSTNGAPRLGTETRASALGVNFIIKT